MIDLDNILATATERIQDGFFLVDIAEGDPIFRERVYCYELYHQMRCEWPEETDFTLNGEIDKSGHPALNKVWKDIQKKPDLVIHRPGIMENYAVIEVKHYLTNRKAILKDIESLTLFQTKAGYQRGIYLIYGHQDSKSVLDELTNGSKGLQFEIWLHPAPGHRAFRIQ